MDQLCLVFLTSVVEHLRFCCKEIVKNRYVLKFSAFLTLQLNMRESVISLDVRFSYRGSQMSK